MKNLSFSSRTKNPVARALRWIKPKVKPSGKLYKRKSRARRGLCCVKIAKDQGGNYGWTRER